MQETLYRRGADGIMERAVPEGRGRAEAMRTFLARGGGLTKMGRYRSGPMKGRTLQEATTMFEDHWAKASGEVKDKYAARARDILSPSEKREAGIGTPAPPKTASQMYSDQKANRMAYYSRINGGSAPNQRQTVLTPARKAPTPAPGSDEARAAALTENSRNERFATADNGDQAMKAAVAMSDGNSVIPESERRTGPGGMYSSADRQKARDFAEAEIAKKKSAGVFDMTNYTGKPVSAPVEQTPIERVLDKTSNAIAGGAKTAWNWTSDKVTAPFTPPSEQIVGKESEAARRTLEAKRAAEAEAAQQKITQENAARLRAEKGLLTPSVATPPPSASSGKPGVAEIPRTGTPSSIEPAETPTGRPVMGDAPKGVNRLTGLPMGHLPGDSLPQKFAGDRQMQSRAADSLVRQQFAEPITAGAPRAIPVLQPKPPTVEQRAAAEMRRQAAINRNPSTVNPDDPKKFFTGRTLPLDQLVNPAKRPSSVYQVGGVGPSGGRVLSIRPARR